MGKPRPKRKMKYPIDPNFVNEAKKKACFSYTVNLVDRGPCRNRARRTVPANLEVNGNHLN
jgi:hypothetical protein